jgi:hypothetical protein
MDWLEDFSIEAMERRQTEVDIDPQFLPNRPQQPWDIETDLGHPRNVQYTVDEGTWMNVDVGLDGWLFFDLLGDIYHLNLNARVPDAPFEPALLLGGVAYEWQPRLSPAGNQLLYSSDKGGNDNIWVADITCSAAACALSNNRPVTDSSYRFINQGVWMDDTSILATKWIYTSGEIWQYPVPPSGGEDGPSLGNLVLRSNPGHEEADVVMTGDAENPWSIYVSRARVRGYNVNVHEGKYAVERYPYNGNPSPNNGLGFYDLPPATTVAGGEGGACRPVISNDGTTMAFIRRSGLNTALVLRDLDARGSGGETILFNGQSPPSFLLHRPSYASLLPSLLHHILRFVLRACFL